MPKTVVRKKGKNKKRRNDDKKKNGGENKKERVRGRGEKEMAKIKEERVKMMKKRMNNVESHVFILKTWNLYKNYIKRIWR